MTQEQYEVEALERFKKSVGYTDRFYRDPDNHNVLVGGYNHNFNEPISPVLAELILEKYDWPLTKNELKKIFSFEALNRLPYKKYLVLVELLFKIGFNKFKTLKDLIKAIEKGDCKEAANSLRNSLLFKQEVKNIDILINILESELSTI